jgi:hypothetical protein
MAARKQNKTGREASNNSAAALNWGVFAVAFLVLIFSADNSAGWAPTSTRAVLAVRLDHSAVSPLYDVVAGAATLLPLGEPAFRLQLLGALLGAFTVMGVVAVSRAWLPKEPAAGLVGAALLLLAPPFREVLATPQMLAACGLVWAIAFGKQNRLRATFAMCALVIGAEPWLGIAAVLAAGIRFGRKQEVAIAVGAIGVMIVVLWFGAIGSLPGLHVSLADAVAVSGQGAAAVVIGAGLLGFGVGVMTKLPNGRVLAAIALLVAVHEIDVGDNAVPMLAIFAIGTSIVASAILHLVANDLRDWKRNAAVLGCGAPLLIAALAMGIATDDPRDTPRRLASDLIDQIPNGPGVFVTTRSPTWFTLQYERTVTGIRPDLELVPPLPAQRADVIVATALRETKIVASDASAFGRLDERFARPLGRAFQLLGAAPREESPVEPPAHYDSKIGETESVALALERGEHEAASGRLAAAARAVGLENRFGAADLAVLSATVASTDRPALFGYLPLAELDRSTLDVFGDDLAWIANIPLADPPITAPKPQKLHALWRKIFIGTLKPDSPEIAALGTDAVAATKLINFGQKNTAQ